MTPEQQTAEIAALKEQIKGALKRIDEQRAQADSIHMLAIAVERNTVELAQMRKDMEAVRQDIEDVKFRPGRRWELVITGIISAGVAMIISFLRGGV